MADVTRLDHEGTPRVRPDPPHPALESAIDRLFGRSDELAAAAQALQAAAAGHGRAVVVEGEPGSGKTRLLDEVRTLGAARGFDVLVGSCDELQVDRPLGPLIDALALHAGSPDPERAEVGLMVAGDGDTGPASDLGYRMVEQVLALLERMAAAHPLLVVIEDIHWADGITRRVVRALDRTLRELPVALFVTVRPYPRGLSSCAWSTTS